ncbi:Os11g0275850 [Oryza sativa Japonica Group]|uniref:Os11g0275850 protein n=1 Tax=Oryza sativa subsp. japonica TaxID=39947 RepID=A0A0P0Y1Z9_ORYSJ|nr:Os11g0275850 [Oryza sativa Japonica Group]
MIWYMCDRGGLLPSLILAGRVSLLLVRATSTRSPVLSSAACWDSLPSAAPRRWGQVRRVQPGGFGVDGLLIGPPLTAVMGEFMGPDSSAGAGDLRNAR